MPLVLCLAFRWRGFRKSRRIAGEKRLWQNGAVLLSVRVHRILGILVFQSVDEGTHHPGKLFGMGTGKVVLLVGIEGEVEELVACAAGLDVIASRLNIRVAVVDDFPIFISIGREVVTAMYGVGIVHEEGLFVAPVRFAGKQSGEVGAVHRMPSGVLGSCEV